MMNWNSTTTHHFLSSFCSHSTWEVLRVHNSHDTFNLFFFFFFFRKGCEKRNNEISSPSALCWKLMYKISRPKLVSRVSRLKIFFPSYEIVWVFLEEKKQSKMSVNIVPTGTADFCLHEPVHMFLRKKFS